MLNNIKSNYIFQIILKEYLTKAQYFNLVRYNKNLQKKLELNINSYKEFYQRFFNRIEIELLPISSSELDLEKKYFFINRKENKSYYNIYFDDNKNQKIDRTFITADDKVKKINIFLEIEIKELKGLFNNCECLKEIKFTKFNRDDFTDFNNMFYGCTNLIKLDVTKFKTSNAKKLSWMFAQCKSLTKLDITNFDTSNVTDMNMLFSGCLHLKELKFNFDTKNVIKMNRMFFKCQSLIKIDVSKFNTEKVSSFDSMFYGCNNLVDLDLNTFNLNKKFRVVDRMFGLCSEKLQYKIRKRFKGMPENAFDILYG